MAANECNPRYPVPRGSNLTCQATAAITGKTLVKITGDRTSDPNGLSDTSDGSNYKVGPVGAGEAAFGVATYDAVSGSKLGVHTTGILPITTGAAVTFWQEVEANASGQVIPHVSGIAIGRALSGASIGADCDVKLYQ